MAFVAAQSTTDIAATLDVTLDVGSSANRKAVAFYYHQQAGSVVVGTVNRNPSGTPEAMTLAASVDILDPGEAFYMLDVFWLDLSVTGSQTFRFNTAGGGPARSAALIVVWDDMAAGAPEAVEEATNSASTTISDIITTLTNNAVVMGGAFFAFTAGQSAPFWTPDNGQTERLDTVVSSIFPVTYGDLVRGTAGAQTFGWTGAATNRVGGSVVVAFAPAVSGPTITTQPANQTVILTNGPSASFAAQATAGSGNISGVVVKRDGVTISNGGAYVITTSGVGTSSASASVAVTVASLSESGDVFTFEFTDAGGTTATAGATLGVYRGPRIATAFGATNGSGVSTGAIETDFPNALQPGSFIRIVDASGARTSRLGTTP